MKKYVYFTVVAAFIAFLGATAFSANSTKAPTVRLEKKSSLTMRDVFTEDSVAAVQSKALELSKSLGPNDKIYLYLDTPGGSIIAGKHLISMLAALPQEVITITSFAASMGFITAESLGERLVTHDGIYMAHRAKVGLDGQMPGEINTRLQFWTDVLAETETNVGSRIALNLVEYRKLTKDEYWVSGEAAVKAKVADKVVDVQCGADLSGTSDETIQTLFGNVTVTFSDCPLISAPLKINFGALEDNVENHIEVTNLKNIIYKVLMDKSSFAGDAVLQNSYYHYVR